jgi:hypothetical protein
MNSFFVFVLALWLYKGSLKARFLMPLMAIPVLVTYLMIQRRAAFSALAIALILMAFVLYKERRAFWGIVPATGRGLACRLNSQGLVPSVLSNPNFPQLSKRPALISLIIENYNI